MSIIATPLGWIMSWMYEIIQNYGIVLILFTFLIRLLLFPLNIKQQKGTAKMSLLQPKMDKLQKKYGKDKARYQEELMKLYEEEGYNPMASCWPLLFQMIFLFGIIEVVYRPLRYMLGISTDAISAATNILTEAGAKVSGSNAQLVLVNILQGNDTSYSADVIQKLKDCFDPQALDAIMNFNMHCFGLNLGEVPTFAWPIILLPILSGVTSLAVSILSVRQQKRNGMSKEQQKTMNSMNVVMYLMPLMSVWFAFSLPSGVMFYWIASNVFSFLQTFVLYKFYTPERMRAIAEKESQKRKKNPSRYQQAMRDARRAQALKEGRTFDESGVNLDDEDAADEAPKKEPTAAERIAQARKRMAEKYGDEYDD